MATLKSRRYPRRVLGRTVGVLSQGQYIIGKGVEIGEGGMMVSLDIEISEDHKILLSFRIPEYGFVVTSAEIKNLKHGNSRFNYGVSFEELAYENRKRIREFIAAKTEMEASKESNRKIS